VNRQQTPKPEKIYPFKFLYFKLKLVMVNDSNRTKSFSITKLAFELSITINQRENSA
jgi:hypothetical protein